jgi:hypothetical protein
MVTRGRRGQGAARPTRTNTNWLLTAAGKSSTPWSQSPNPGRLKQRSTSPQTRWTLRWQTNADAGPNERRLQVMIRRNHLYVGRTVLNPKILQHPMMDVWPIMPSRTITDQILMEWWRKQQPIVLASRDCDCYIEPYQRGEGYCRKSTRAFRSWRPLRIYYNRGLNNAKRYAAFIWHAYDKNEALVGEGYTVSSDSFNPSESSSSNAE